MADIGLYLKNPHGSGLLLSSVVSTSLKYFKLVITTYPVVCKKFVIAKMFETCYVFKKSVSTRSSTQFEGGDPSSHLSITYTTYPPGSRGSWSQS